MILLLLLALAFVALVFLLATDLGRAVLYLAACIVGWCLLMGVAIAGCLYFNQPHD